MSISFYISENNSLTHSHFDFTRNGREVGRQVVNDIFKCILLTENICVFSDISLNIHSDIFNQQIALENVVCMLILGVSFIIGNSALGQVMACRRTTSKADNRFSPAFHHCYRLVAYLLILKGEVFKDCATGIGASAYLSSYTGYFWEPHWKPMGLPEISRVTWKVCNRCGIYCSVFIQARKGPRLSCIWTEWRHGEWPLMYVC